MCSVLLIFYGYTRESLNEVCAYGVSCVMREKLLLSNFVGAYTTVLIGSVCYILIFQYISEFFWG